MNITVFGASGRTGTHVVGKALDDGHRITAFVRDPAKLTLTHQELSVVKGDLFDLDDVEQSVKGADAVVSTIGQSRKGSRHTVANGTEKMVEAMTRQGVHRIVAVSTMGAGDSAKHIGFVMRTLLRTILRKQVMDHERQEGILRNSGLDWTVVRPGSLQNEPGTGHYQVGYDLGVGRIAREDIADFILTELKTGAHLHHTPSVIG
jgi:putative NADH-flavin reductase